jgi:hypothetical protein
VYENAPYRISDPAALPYQEDASATKTSPPIVLEKAVIALDGNRVAELAK